MHYASIFNHGNSFRVRSIALNGGINQFIQTVFTEEGQKPSAVNSLFPIIFTGHFIGDACVLQVPIVKGPSAVFSSQASN